MSEEKAGPPPATTSADEGADEGAGEAAGPVGYVLTGEPGARVATIRIQRPEAMNGLDLATKEGLLAATARAAEDDEVRCVVLTGTGRAFCVGQDLKEHLEVLRRRDEGGGGEVFDTVREHYNPLLTTLATMPKPVVAAVNGVAAGAGASLAMACDLRVVAESAGFNLAFAGVALSCDTGSSWTLPRLVGRAKALELLYLPRTVGATEAAELGLATTVVPDADLATEVDCLATRLAQGPTTAYASMRAAVLHAEGTSLADALEHEAGLMDRTGATADHREAVRAFLAKETPAFTGR